MRNFEPRAGLALLCVALLLVLSGGPGHVAASGVSDPVIYGLGSLGVSPVVSCDSHVAFTVPGNTTALLIPGVVGQLTYVCSFIFSVSVQNVTKFVRGTGVTCATGLTDMTGGMTAGTGRPIGLGSDLGWIMRTVNTGEDVCLNATNAASSVGGVASYTQF